MARHTNLLRSSPVGRIASLVRPSVRLSAPYIRALSSKTKGVDKSKLVLTFSMTGVTGVPIFSSIDRTSSLLDVKYIKKMARISRKHGLREN